MALRDTAGYHDWIRREQPTLTAQRVARTFLAEIGDQAWRSPSIPVAELSDQPEYEVRVASLPVADEVSVRTWYRHFFATDDVDIIAITNR